MKIHFLGTAAAEGWPAVFCRCESCIKAKRLGGPNIRTRSSVLIDETLKIDLPPDTYLHMLRDGLDLSKVEALLFTHSHSDHLYPQELGMRLPGYAHGCEQPLHIYGHDIPIRLCKKEVGNRGDLFKFHLVQPYQTFQIGGTTVTALLADHDRSETCLLYFIEKNGKSIFYAHDTGWFPEQTWEWLSNKTFDMVILDCTNGPIPERRNHMDIEAVTEITTLFRERKMLKENGKAIVTHFSHNGGLLHEELCSIFEPKGISVAYDGLMIDI